jgi:hypothetical protein
VGKANSLGFAKEQHKRLNEIFWKFGAVERHQNNLAKQRSNLQRNIEKLQKIQANDLILLHENFGKQRFFCALYKVTCWSREMIATSLNVTLHVDGWSDLCSSHIIS